MARLPPSLEDQLVQATHRGDVDALKSLLAQGADAKHEEGYALRTAAFHGFAACAEALLPWCDPKENDSAALAIACQYGHADCVRILIPASDPKAARSYPLRAAIRGGFADCVALLLPVSDLDVPVEYGISLSESARVAGRPHIADMIDAFREARELSDSVDSSESAPKRLSL